MDFMANPNRTRVRLPRGRGLPHPEWIDPKASQTLISETKALRRFFKQHDRVKTKRSKEISHLKGASRGDFSSIPKAGLRKALQKNVRQRQTKARLDSKGNARSNKEIQFNSEFGHADRKVAIDLGVGKARKDIVPSLETYVSRTKSLRAKRMVKDMRKNRLVRVPAEALRTVRFATPAISADEQVLRLWPNSQPISVMTDMKRLLNQLLMRAGIEPNPGPEDWLKEDHHARNTYRKERCGGVKNHCDRKDQSLKVLQARLNREMHSLNGNIDSAFPDADGLFDIHRACEYEGSNLEGVKQKLGAHCTWRCPNPACGIKLQDVTKKGYGHHPVFEFSKSKGDSASEVAESPEAPSRVPPPPPPSPSSSSSSSSSGSTSSKGSGIKIIRPVAVKSIPTPPQAPQAPGIRDEALCFRCGKRGHVTSVCRVHIPVTEIRDGPAITVYSNKEKEVVVKPVLEGAPPAPLVIAVAGANSAGVQMGITDATLISAAQGVIAGGAVNLTPVPLDQGRPFNAGSGFDTPPAPIPIPPPPPRCRPKAEDGRRVKFISQGGICFSKEERVFLPGLDEERPATVRNADRNMRPIAVEDYKNINFRLRTFCKIVFWSSLISTLLIAAAVVFAHWVEYSLEHAYRAGVCWERADYLRILESSAEHLPFALIFGVWFTACAVAVYVSFSCSSWRVCPYFASVLQLEHGGTLPTEVACRQTIRRCCNINVDAVGYTELIDNTVTAYLLGHYHFGWGFGQASLRGEAIDPGLYLQW